MTDRSDPSAHRIRLRGPWHYTPLAGWDRCDSGERRSAAGPLPGGGTCRVPTSWNTLFGERFFGRTRFERSFGCPTGIGPGDKISLLIVGFERPQCILLNGAALAVQTIGNNLLKCDVSQLLQARNVLSIEIEFSGDTGQSCPIGHAELVIHTAH